MAVKRVLVQMGHVAPRDPNHERETGAAGEQDLVKLIGPRLANLLNADPRFEAVLRPGLLNNLGHIDAALFLHGDGSSNPQTSGFSYGFPVHPVNERLRSFLEIQYRMIPGHPPHRTDNYTPDLRGYYGFNRVNTTGPEVLIEHGFLSNVKDRAWMFSNVDKIAQAHYNALLRYFGFSPLPGKPYLLRKVRKDGTVKVEEVARLGVANAVQLFLRGQFKELKITRQ